MPVSVMSNRDVQITENIARQLRRSAEESRNLAAGYRADGHEVTADYIDEVARRFEQLAKNAEWIFANCDALDALRANAAAENAETEVCRVH